MRNTVFATVLLVPFFILALPNVSQARNDVFLAQTLSDLNSVQQSALPAPAPQVKVDIPPSRVMPLEPKMVDVVRLSTGQSKTITLDQDAASVIVANPSHATVFLDNPRSIIIVPRAVGATNFKVLNRFGDTILNQPIIVNDTDDSAYVRVTRICAGAANCMAATTYYCPDNCVPVAVPQPETNVAYPTIPPIAALPPLPVVGGTGQAPPEGAN